jgi:outer membrane protein assembly factor BamB
MARSRRRWNDRAFASEHRTGLRILAFCALLGLVPALVLIASLPANGATPSRSGRSLDVVGGPIVAGADVVVVSVDRSQTLHLDGVNPVTDAVLWQRPYAASATTPAIALTPAATGTTVADVVPAAHSATPSVTVDGVNAATGAIEWKLPDSFILSDNPSPCVGGQDFCLPAYTAGGSAQLTIIDAATGQPASVLSGPSRALGTNLYQSSNETPTLDQLSATGSIAWSEPVSSIFGPGYDPGTGWNIGPVGDLNVGTVGVAASGTSVDLSRYKTVGFSTTTGMPQWSLPGSYQCMGPLAFLSTPVACRYKGTIRYSTTSLKPPSMRGISLTLAGFDPTTGATTWSAPVSNVTSLTTGKGVRFVDSDHVVVGTTSGRAMSLDTSTGAAAPLAAHQVLWCETIPTYSVRATRGNPVGGKRTGTTLYAPCTARGAKVAGPPSTDPSTIGVTVNGIFVWASPAGLQTHVTGPSPTNT